VTILDEKVNESRASRAANLVDRAESFGAELRAVDGRIVGSNLMSIDPAVRAEIRSHTAEVVAYLEERAAVVALALLSVAFPGMVEVSEDEIRELAVERAAVREPEPIPPESPPPPPPPAVRQVGLFEEGV
jgi:hypothetical protein